LYQTKDDEFEEILYADPDAHLSPKDESFDWEFPMIYIHIKVETSEFGKKYVSPPKRRSTSRNTEQEEGAEDQYSLSVKNILESRSKNR